METQRGAPGGGGGGAGGRVGLCGGVFFLRLPGAKPYMADATGPNPTRTRELGRLELDLREWGLGELGLSRVGPPRVGPLPISRLEFVFAM